MGLGGRGRDTLKNVRDEQRAFLRRTAAGILLCILGIGTLMWRLVSLQVEQHDYFSTRANENRMRLVPVAPVRGLIFDRNGIVLAQNQPAFVLTVTPEAVDDLTAMLDRLSGLINLQAEEIERFRDRVRKYPRYAAVPLRNDLSMDEVANIEIRRHELEGVEVRAALARDYPGGTAVSHVIGYVGGLTEDELRRVDPDAYQGIEQIGKNGVERSHEDILRGTPGAKIIETNAHGRPLRELDYRHGYPGKNIALSLDLRVQQVAEQALGELNGSVVAIDPRNGEVLALVSKPGFDAQVFAHGISRDDYTALLADPNRPLFNRALQGRYPPGSTVKPAMAVAGLEFGVVDPGHTEYCSGGMSLPGSSRRYRCWKRTGHGTVDMATAVKRSCDVYFYQLSLKLGIDRIHQAMTDFGLGTKTGIDLPNEADGLFPSREWKKRVRRENWYPGETLNIGIGQGYTLVTPLQLAQMAARIAMRGAGFKPHVLKSTQDAITGAVESLPPEALPPIEIADPQYWDAVIEAMHEVAHTQQGTAWLIGKTAPYQIAAKTGTAQVAALKQDEKAPTLEDTPLHLRDHALFIAFAPVEDPRIAVAVIAEHGGHGGSAAGPIARKVMDQYLLGEVRYGLAAASPTTPPPPAPTALPAGEIQ